MEPESDADEKAVELKNDAELIVKDISLAFKNQKKELLGLPPRNTSTITEYESDPNKLNIDEMVEEELIIEKEVLVLEKSKQKAEFNYFYKLYEWSQRKDQQVSWLYNNPKVAKTLLDITIDSNTSLEKSHHKVR